MRHCHNKFQPGLVFGGAGVGWGNDFTIDLEVISSRGKSWCL